MSVFVAICLRRTIPPQLCRSIGQVDWGDMAIPGLCRFLLMGQSAARGCGVLTLALAIQWFVPSSGATEAPRRILMLHAFNFTFPSTTIIADAARKRLLETSSQ